MKYAFLGPESTGKTTTAIEIVRRRNGILVPEVTAKSVAAAIQRINVDGADYKNWLVNIKVASEVLCWENEEKVIEEVYGDLLK